MKLVIGNKLYSSWSLRPWILLTELGIPFEEIQIPLDTLATKAEIAKHTPAGRVPVLLDGDIRVWESLAIIEYVAESKPEAWPKDKAARALARAISSEMHAGFLGLRKACPMNLGKKYAQKDRGPDVAKDVARLTALWKDARDRFGKGGPFLFGAFTAADAMFAPVVTRLDTYSIQVDVDTRAYMTAVLNTAAFRKWKEAALKEPWTIAADEIDEKPVESFR